MYKLINNQVLKIEKLGNSTVTQYFEIDRINKIKNENEIILQWTKFNTELEIWEDNLNNNNMIQYKQNQYIPVDGKVTIPIINEPIIIEPTETELLRNEVSDLKSQLSELIAFLRGG